MLETPKGTHFKTLYISLLSRGPVRLAERDGIVSMGGGVRFRFGFIFHGGKD